MHWFVVASQKEARIFTKVEKRLKLQKTLTNPLASEKKRELIRKQAGRGVKSIGKAGSVNYSMPKRHDPHEEAVTQFAREISHYLQAEKNKKSFESMSLFAEPHLLGRIRAHMHKDLQSSVTDWIKKDLQKTPESELGGYLQNNL